MIAEGKVERGDVLVSLNHEFEDGNVAPRKFLVIYGCRSGNVLFFLTTSQQKFGRLPNPGCRHEYIKYDSSFHILPPKKKTGKFKNNTRKGFAVPTWVVLAPQFWPEHKLLALMAANRVYRDFSLAQNEYDEIKKCFLTSPGGTAPVYQEF